MGDDMQRWVTVTDNKPDLDEALIFVVQTVEKEALMFMPTITIQAAWRRDPNTGEGVVLYQCSVSGRTDENVKNLATLSPDED